MLPKSFAKIKNNIQTLWCDTADNQKFPVLKVGQGKPVILLHGFGMDAHAWLPFIWSLTDKHCFYLPYLRGFSKSSSLTFSQDDFFADYAQDVTNMRSQLDLDNVLLGGISMGAMTCMAMHAYSLDQNNTIDFSRVERCLLIDQSPVILNREDWQWGLMGTKQNEFINKLTAVYESTAPYLQYEFDDLPQDVKTKLIDAIAAMIGASFNAKSMQLVTQFMTKFPELAVKLRNTDGWANQRHMIGGYLYQGYDFRKYAPKLDIPVTVITCTDSKLYHPDGQRAYANMMPNSQVIQVDNAGHALPFDRPIKTYQLIKDFVSI